MRPLLIGLALLTYALPLRFATAGKTGFMTVQEVPQVPVQGVPQAVRISGGVMAAQLLTRVDPMYPPEARPSTGRTRL